MALICACAQRRLTSETSFCLVNPYRPGKGFRNYSIVDAILWWCLRIRRCCLFRYFVRTEDLYRDLLVPEKMTQFLPPNLLALFAPRDPIPYLPPVSKLPHEKKNGGYIGVGGFLKYFEEPKDTPPPVRVETREERLERRRRERAEQVAYKLEQEIAVWDPAGIPNVTADPFKTLFVARI
ncbi:unnamed protein product, partial [Heterotrigona itama]